jgi:hypothetical protein
MLTRFQEAKIISIKGRTVTVLDMNRLREEAEVD